MRVVAFAASLNATDEEAGGITATGFPMTSLFVENFPAQVTIPLVAAFCAPGGGDYDPVQHIIATSPEGARVGALELSWHWPDNPPVPIKFRVFAQYLSMRVESAGLYTIGLYDSLHAADADHVYPLPVLGMNPPLPDSNNE